MAGFYDNTYNPDVLLCLANLSNDEVFTPPDVANQILDMLPQELFSDPNTKSLDPACKSGVFLREIAKRLIVGLANTIPDLQERIDHIMHKQLYAIAITELTAMLSRRSVYCSKYPNGPFAVSHFETAQGNIKFHKIQHTWKNGKCLHCSASQEEYDRGDELESHAYEFIHTLKPEELFNMKFDVVVGNPPYSMQDGGGDGTSAAPIYNLFIENAKKLNPKYLTMIVPARWYSGGKGLDSFRDGMLHDQRLAIIHDFPETAECFPGLNIRGGVCYFLWDRNHKGDCKIINHNKGELLSDERPLLEQGATTFIRYNKAISILHKVQELREETMDNRVSSRLPFGIPSNFSDFSAEKTERNNVILYRSERGNSKTANKKVWISSEAITKNSAWKDKQKVLVSKASPGGDDYPHAIITEPIYAEKNSVCTETYLIVDFVNSKDEADNLISYMKTKFFRFMMALIKNTQNISKSVFAFVPVQVFSKPWTDEELYKKYNLTDNEIAFIESMIKPMDLNGGDT